MNHSHDILTPRLCEESQRLGDVVSDYVASGINPYFVALFETCIRPMGEAAVIAWYRQHQNIRPFQNAIVLIDMVSFLSSSGIPPFTTVQLRCHGLLKPPPIWRGTDHDWVDCTVNATDQLGSLVDADSSYEQLFNTLGMIAGKWRDNLNLRPFSPPGITIEIVRNWMRHSYESDSPNAIGVIRMCNLMDEMELF